MPKITLELPDVSLLGEHTDPRHLDDPDALANELRLAAALFWFQRGMISAGKAAEVAGVPRAQFIELTAKHRIPNVDVDLDEIRHIMSKESVKGG